MTNDLMTRTASPGFATPLNDLSYAVSSDEDRCVVRHRLSIPAQMRFSCSKSFAVEVSDLSLAGFACDALVEAHKGTICWLTLPGLGAMEAEVVHHGNSGLGCAFKNMLNLAVLNHFVAKYSSKD